MEITVVLLVMLALTVSAVTVLAVDGSVKHPVILMPGDGASQLVARLNKTTSKYRYCPKYTSGYTTLWLSYFQLLPKLIECLAENMKLWYDPITHKTHSTPGVDIEVPDFGNTSSVEFLDMGKKMHYFHAIVEDLVSLGYSRGVSVRGAPYDFRKAPNEFDDYFSKLKDLIEETYKINNNTKVVVIAHSMGNPVFLYFLNHQPQEWKDKFVQAHISLAGVWGGAVKSIRLMTSGYNFGAFVIRPAIIREVQRSMPSTAFLMPSDRFWNSSEVLVSTPEKNYTVDDYKEFFQDLNYTTGYDMRIDTEDLVRDLVPPQVRVHCLHGSGVQTSAGLVFKKDGFPNKEPSNIPGDGDGTVNMRSLLGCVRWTGKQKYPVIHKVYSGQGSGHMAILVNQDVRNYIHDVVTGKI